MHVTIQLTFRRSDFEDIFFRNGNEKLFLHASVKRSFFITLAMASGFCGLLIKDWLNGAFTDMQVISGILLAVCGWDLYSKLKPLLKWRKSIKDYLDRNSAYHSHRILLTDAAFSVIQDTVESIETWNAFKTAEISDEYIRLVASNSYLIPAKSVTSEEYTLLRQMITQKIKQEEQ